MNFTTSTLQLGILAIGALLVIIVYVYNVMQERKIRKRMDAAFKVTEDPLLSGSTSRPAPAEPRERIEPRMSMGGAAGSGRAGGAGGPGGRGGSGDEVAEIPVAPEAMIPEAPPIPALAVEPEPVERGSPPLANEPAASDLPDPDIECVARLQGVNPVPGSVLADAVGHAYMKPCRWVGRQVNGVWSAVRDGQTYTEVAACMVLADRDGPMSEQGYNDFREHIEELGQELPAAFIVGERRDELQRASDLDAFCADVDIQIGLNLLRKDGGRWTGTRLRGVSEASGFKLNGNGQFDYHSEENAAMLFRLQNREEHPLLADSMKQLQTGGITILLDVPRVPEPVKAYDSMRALVRRLAVTLDAELVDDNGRPLTDAGLTTIRSQLQTVQATMRAKGIEPGGTRALRLFN